MLMVSPIMVTRLDLPYCPLTDENLENIQTRTLLFRSAFLTNRLTGINYILIQDIYCKSSILIYYNTPLLK